MTQNKTGKCHIEKQCLLRHNGTSISRRSFIVFLCAFIFILPLPVNLPAQQHLVLNTPGNPPYHYPDQTGIFDLVLKEAFARIGIEVTLELLPPERGLISANMGILDGDAGRIAGISSQYENLIQVPEKILVSDFVAFTKDVSFKPSGWQSLKPYNVAIVRGHKVAEKNISGTKSLVKAHDTEILFALLDNHRVDVAVCERLFGSMVARKTSPAIKMTEAPLATVDFYLYLHRKHEALVPKITQALRSMKRDGAYERLFMWGQNRRPDNL